MYLGHVIAAKNLFIAGLTRNLKPHKPFHCPDAGGTPALQQLERRRIYSAVAKPALNSRASGAILGRSERRASPR
jgi:hypothetical protein